MNYYTKFIEQSNMQSSKEFKKYVTYVDVMSMTIPKCPFCGANGMTVGNGKIVCNNEKCKWSAEIEGPKYVNIESEKGMLENRRKFIIIMVNNLIKESVADGSGSEEMYNKYKNEMIDIDDKLESINRIYSEHEKETGVLRGKRFNHYKKLYELQQDRKTYYVCNRNNALFEVYKNEYPFKNNKRAGELAKQYNMDVVVLVQLMNWFETTKKYVTVSNQIKKIEEEIASLKKKFNRTISNLLIEIPKIIESPSKIKKKLVE